ncbi:MAG: hypothetical protein V1748_08325 [Actinomycetota bacterium]
MKRTRKKPDGLKEEKYRKRIAAAEKKALKASVDSSVIQRLWELVSLFPKITDPRLERRVERFILNAAPGQFFVMQQVLANQLSPLLAEDERVGQVLCSLEGKCIGLCITGEYESTLTFKSDCLVAQRGISDHIPVISAESRRDYADAILNIKDPVKLILGRRIRATHKFTLLRWGLPHLDIIRDKSLLEKYLSYQPEIEQILEDTLTRMGY